VKEDTGSYSNWDWWSSIDHKFTTLPTTTSPIDIFCFALCLFLLYFIIYIYIGGVPQKKIIGRVLVKNHKYYREVIKTFSPTPTFLLCHFSFFFIRRNI